MSVAERLYEAAKDLPEPLIKEALDFVLFLRAQAERAALRDLMDAQQVAMRHLWDNPEDQVWDNV